MSIRFLPSFTEDNRPAGACASRDTYSGRSPVPRFRRVQGTNVDIGIR